MRLVIGLALAGLGISLYIWRKQETRTPLLCLTRDCYRVIHSPQARLFGVPNGALGSLMFAAIALLGAGMDGGLGASFLLPVAIAIALAGVVLAAYLTYVQIFVLRGVCDWCLLSAVLITTVFLLLLRRI